MQRLTGAMRIQRVGEARGSVTPFDPGIILNSGFETAGAGGADIWANWLENPVDGTLSDDTTIFYRGGHSCKITCTVGRLDFVYQIFVVVPGDEYTFSGMARGNGVSAPRYALRDQTAGVFIIDKASTGVTAEAWGHWSVDFIIPAGCISLAVRLYGPAAAAAGWHDQVSLKKKLADYLLNESGLDYWTFEDGAKVEL